MEMRSAKDVLEVNSNAEMELVLHVAAEKATKRLILDGRSMSLCVPSAKMGIPTSGSLAQPCFGPGDPSHFLSLQ